MLHALCPLSELKWIKIPMNVDFCWYRKEVCPVMASYLEMAGLLAFVSTSTYYIQSAHVRVWSAAK